MSEGVQTAENVFNKDIKWQNNITFLNGYLLFSNFYANVFAIIDKIASENFKAADFAISRIGEALNSKAQRDCTAEFNLKCEI